MLGSVNNSVWTQVIELTAAALSDDIYVQVWKQVGIQVDRRVQQIRPQVIHGAEEQKL